MRKWYEFITYLLQENIVSETEVPRPKGGEVKVEAQKNQKYNGTRSTITLEAQSNQKYN